MKAFGGVILIIVGALLALLGGGCSWLLVSAGGAKDPGISSLTGFWVVVLMAGLGLIFIGLALTASAMTGSGGGDMPEPGTHHKPKLTPEQVKAHLDDVTRKHIAELERERKRRGEPPRSRDG